MHNNRWTLSKNNFRPAYLETIRLTKITANAKLVEGTQLALDDNRTHSYIVDQEPKVGRDLGSSPLELCVMSHAGCYATICVLVARKMRLNLKDIEVHVEAAKTEGTAATISEENFTIQLKIDAPQDKIDKLHRLTLENCPVGILFERAGVKINYKLDVFKEY